MRLPLLPLALLCLAGTAGIVGLAVRAGSEADNKAPAAAFSPQGGRAFEEPPVLRSRSGRLRTTFTVQKGRVTIAGAQVRGMSYRGDFIGPTLRVRPGDTIEIRLANHLREPTNLHFHGLHVSPSGISDNVLRTMRPGSDNAVRVRLPRTLSPGTYWYHAHEHGLVEEQISSGLAGVIVVDGLTQRLPLALRHVPETVIALKEVQIHDGRIAPKGGESNAPTTRTVNGLVEPAVRVRTNQAQLLRLANISADVWYRLDLQGTPFTVVAEDANPVGRVWAADELILPPGKRYDVLVRWRGPGTSSYGRFATARGRRRHVCRTHAGHGARRRHTGCRRGVASLAGPPAGASACADQARPLLHVRGGRGERQVLHQRPQVPGRSRR